MKTIKERKKRVILGKQPEVFCPDCNGKLTFLSRLETDWYGVLTHYSCRRCREIFVSQDGGELEVAV